MRLRGIGGRCGISGKKKKDGRIVPSAVLFLTRRVAGRLHIADDDDDALIELDSSVITAPQRHGDDDDDAVVVACVGAPAMRILQRADDDGSFPFSYDDVSAALVTGVKRLLGVQHVDAEGRPSPDDDGETSLTVRPLGCDDRRVLSVTPSRVTAILLTALRRAAERYLRRHVDEKRLRVPGDGASCRRAVLGVPAHYDDRASNALLRAARVAGFTSATTVLTESTAAALSYGLHVTDATRTVFVWDGGAGTTDVTIAVLRRSGGDDDSNDDYDDAPRRFRVVVTEGESNGLGGDDMDAALLETIVLPRAGLSSATTTTTSLSPSRRRRWLHKCRAAKEHLCGDVDHGASRPEDRVSIHLDDDIVVEVTQADLEEALRPWMDRATRLVQRALERLDNEADGDDDVSAHVDEVVLVGGASRVPAVRRMLRSLVPTTTDPCTTVNALSAVARGAAVQAAVASRSIPRHEIRSALMLDTVPHAVGALLSSDNTDASFVPIIPRDAPLPASGSAVFQLADPLQPGFTVTAVEQVMDDDDDDQRRFLYPKLGEFTFLLARPSRGTALNGSRSIEVIMTLRQSGEFVVSYYDENDPEHLGRKGSSPRGNPSQQPSDAAPALAFHPTKDGTRSFEQITLLVSCIVLFVAYVAARIYFQEELSAKAE